MNTLASNSVPTEGIFSRHAEEQLSNWLEHQPSEQFTGWIAIHFNAPAGFMPLSSIWENTEKLKAADLEISEGMLKGELHLFLLEDYSAIAMLRNRSRLDMAEVQKHLNSIIYKAATTPNTKVYDLSIALSEFKNLCHQKVMDTQKSSRQASTAAAPVVKPVLDVSALAAPEFRAAVKTRTKRRKPLVILVDDDKVTLKLLERLMKDYKPLTASSAAEAIKLYAEQAPDICFLDIGLPDFSGLEVLQAIHKYDVDAFVVMLSAKSSQHNLEEALHNGIKGFIAKPFTIAKISHYLDTFRK